VASVLTQGKTLNGIKWDFSAVNEDWVKNFFRF
jgi:hypothetical protein